MIGFVHIPKTAGTSFRTAAAEYFGEEFIYADYGPKAGETSSDIRENMYESSDLYNIKVLAQKKSIRLLTGHVHSSKYSPVIVSCNMATFLRHPVEQVISHYEHHLRHHSYDKSLEEFIVERRFTNLQTRVLDDLPLELYGFLGITERYNHSIDLFNSFYDVDFKKLSLNTKKKKGKGALKPKFNSLKELDQKIHDLIIEQNSRDMLAYQLALDIFDERYRMLQLGHKYAMGFVGRRSASFVSGVACLKDSEQAVELEVLLNGEVDGECKATEPRPHLRGLNVPRGGYIGFTCHFSRPVTDQDEVKVVVKATGQVMLKKRQIS